MCYTVGGERNVLLNHPDHVEHVLAANRANYSKDTAANRYFRTEIANGILTADGDAGGVSGRCSTRPSATGHGWRPLPAKPSPPSSSGSTSSPTRAAS